MDTVPQPAPAVNTTSAAYRRGLLVGRMAVVSMLGLGLIGVGALITGARGPQPAAPAALRAVVAQAPAPPSSVHVCTLAHYGERAVLCTQDDPQIADLSSARLQYEVDNGTFAKDTCVMSITEFNSAGSESGLGATTDTGLLGYATTSTLLGSDFEAAGVVPTAGARYRITVGYSDQANGMTQLLGSATFTYDGP